MKTDDDNHEIMTLSVPDTLIAVSPINALLKEQFHLFNTGQTGILIGIAIYVLLVWIDYCG